MEDLEEKYLYSSSQPYNIILSICTDS
jgi:hypothetical protein